MFLRPRLTKSLRISILAGLTIALIYGFFPIIISTYFSISEAYERHESARIIKECAAVANQILTQRAKTNIKTNTFHLEKMDGVKENYSKCYFQHVGQRLSMTIPRGPYNCFSGVPAWRWEEASMFYGPSTDQRWGQLCEANDGNINLESSFNTIEVPNRALMEQLKSKYKKIFLYPVSAALLEMHTSERFNDPNDKKAKMRDAQNMANYFEQEIRTFFKT